MMYKELIEPMIEKVLNGFYCTVLAYGQTGTGKSFTMGLQQEVCADALFGFKLKLIRILRFCIKKNVLFL